MKASRQPRCLVHDVPGSVHEQDRNKNFLHAEHHATYNDGTYPPRPTGRRVP